MFTSPSELSKYISPFPSRRDENEILPVGIAAVGGDVGEVTAAVGVGEAAAAVDVGEAAGAVGVAASSPSSHAVANAIPRKSSTMTNILKA
jgi:hypothetical protein